MNLLPPIVESFRIVLACTVASAAALAFQAPPAGPAPLTGAFACVTVAERQILQRDDKNGFDLIVEGSCRDGSGALELLIARGNDTVLEKRLEMQDMAGPSQQFRSVVRVPAGGWYSLRITEAGEHEPRLEVQRFGVGEVFVVAGQSNSTNFGEERFGALDDFVCSFDGMQWKVAQDPMPGVQDGSNGGSPWPLFGHLLRQSLGVPVGIASVGFGGTSVRHWQKDHEYYPRENQRVVLYDGLRQRVDALRQMRAILWHQGETDAAGGLPKDDYLKNFLALQSTLAKDIDGTLPPWVVAHASYVPGLARERMDAIRAAQTELWTTHAALQGPDTDDLLGDLRHSKDHIHFSKLGLEVHAQRWYAMVWAQFFAEPKLVPAER